MAKNNFISFKFFKTLIKIGVTTAVVILYIHYFFPQSWGFYTVEAKHPLYNIYKIYNGVVDKEPYLKNNMSYGMGISQKGRVIYNEVYSIIDKNLPWRPVIEDSIDYEIKHEKYSKISTGSEYAALVGKFLITRADRPSYLILKGAKKFHPSKKYILVDIRAK
jgi:hypothetical protein